MKKNLFDYADTSIFENNNEELSEDLKKKAENIDDNTKKNVNELYNKYKNYSSADLLNEFLTTSKQKIKDGSLSKESLKNTINSLSPYITSEQKSYLENIIKKIDD